MSYGFRRVPFAPEMDAFQAEVGREQYFVIAGGSQYRTIVADAPDCPGPSPALATDSSDKRFFSEGQTEINIQQVGATDGDCW